MNPKNAVALGIVFVLITTAFIPMLSTSVISDYKESKTVSISVIPNTKTAKSRTPGYAVYNLTVSSTVGIAYIDLEAGNASVWTVEFLNESGVPLNKTPTGKPGINNPIATQNYYVLTKVKVPSSIANGTQQVHTIYANGSDGNKATTVLTTICDMFSTLAPHGIVGTAKYPPPAGGNADGALALLINIATGETSYDTVGTTGASNTSGYGSTDTSQMPSGCANNTWLQIIASDAANNTYGTFKIQMNNATAYQWANVTLNITVSAAVTPGAVKNVVPSNDTGKVNLSWSTVSGATGYYVYKSTDRFAVFPSGWTKSSPVSTTYWSDAAGTYTDSSTYYYTVRAYTTGASPEEGGNSSMVCKIRKIYHVNPTGASLNVISLPYNCSYKNASHIVAAIEGGNGTGTGSPSVNISKVLKWNNATQNWGYSWSYALGKWSGNDFSIVPGDGIAIYVKAAEFGWTVVGSDLSCPRVYHVNPTGASLNVISLPFTMAAVNALAGFNASDIVAAIEGGNGTGTGSPSLNISKVLKWNNATQNWGYSWSYALGKWSGNDFSIEPGDGIAIYVKATEFTWTPVLITPAV